MKKIAFLLILFAAKLYGQGGGNPIYVVFAGAPSGSCASISQAVNASTGAFYTCSSGVWTQVGGVSSCPTCVTSSASLTSNSVVLGAGGQGVSTNTAFTTNGTTTLTVGVAAGGNGVLALSGNTSGTATFTAPAVAGTVTNAVVMSNNIAGPNGTAVAPTYNWSNSYGLYFGAGVGPTMAVNAADSTGFAGNETRMLSTGRFTFCPSTTMNCTIDTGISRDAAGVVDIGTGAQGNTSGVIKAAAHISVGTKFTTNNGCSDSATAGGATAGTFTVGSTSCTEVVTMGNSATAPNGWSCTVVDITTLADVTNPHQTTSNATTATFVTGTVVSGDKIQFSCIGY